MSSGRGRTILLVVLAVVVLIAAACTRSPDAVPADGLAVAEGRGVVTGAGGTVTGVDGASLTVPAQAVLRPSMVTIKKVGDGYDIHLEGDYRGPLLVAVPVGDLDENVEPFLLHETAAGFVIEDAALVGGFLVAEVRSLSLFKALKCVRQEASTRRNPRVAAKRIAACLLREALPPAISKQVFKRILREAECGEVASLYDIQAWITGEAACPAGETPEDIARLRAALTTLPPSPAPTAPPGSVPRRTAPPANASPATTVPASAPPETSPPNTAPPDTVPPTTAPPRRPPGVHYDVPVPDNAGGYDSRAAACGCGRQSFVAVYDTVTTATFVSYKGRGTADIAITLLDDRGARLAERRFTLPANQVTTFTADFNRHPVTQGATYYMELRALSDGMTIYLGNGDPYPQGRGYFEGKGPEDFAMTINGEDL